MDRTEPSERAYHPQDGAIATNMELPGIEGATVELSVAVLAGFISAEIPALHRVHPVQIYRAIQNAREVMDIDIYINAQPIQTTER